MGGAALGIVMVAILAAPGCGYATSPSPPTLFALDAGNYTLKISGSGLCSGAGTSPREGSVPVTVTRAATTWSVRSVQAADTFAMSFTTDGAAVGSARGEVSGSMSNAGLITAATGSLSGTNSATNVAGGPSLIPPAFPRSRSISVSRPAAGRVLRRRGR